MILINLKNIRENQNLTQEKLSQISGISQQHICMIENGSRTGSLNTLKKLAKALNVSLDRLISI